MDTKKYDRALQLEILNALMDADPSPLRKAQEDALIAKFSDYKQFVANAIYLERHGLIEKPFVVVSALSGSVDYVFNATACRLTEKGIDFLIGDEGLSSLLNVLVVRLHADTLEALQEVVNSSALPPEKKKGLLDKLKELPADSIKHLTLQLLTQGVLNLPHAVQLIQKALT
ncbi:hypothetical protein NG99_26650 [Erwinia typographi]|uniref:Uncharacterized protein n=1 Tax=Erwinia typographi TaxID=371042 RepID=A0A0A3YKX1_9GAMM|nr:hypothetical protein [Erwinia typographi]KGT86144.1 hypothetical protein NG99_26650 [Erwinia typographi]